MPEQEKRFSKQLLGKTVVSKSGKRFGEVGDIVFETHSGELIHLVLSNPTSYTEKMELEKEGIIPYLANIHTIKPLDRKLVLELARKTNCIITAEDHNVIGGLGSAVAELLAEEYPCRMKRIGLNDRYAESGKPSELYEKYGLSSGSIAKEVKSMLKNKK